MIRVRPFLQWNLALDRLNLASACSRDSHNREHVQPYCVRQSAPIRNNPVV